MSCSLKENNNTVDHKDVDHFNELAKAQRWWSDVSLLCLMNDVRVPFVLNAAKECGLSENNSLKGLKVLDVGCGAGIVTEDLAKLGADVIGLDAGDEVIKLAKVHAQNNIDIDNDKITYICSTIEEFCQEHKNSFDLIVASEIIEHVFNPSLFMKCCIETLKPNCPIIVTTINRTWYARMKTVIFFEYIMNLIPRGTHDWYKFLTPNEVHDIFQAWGCQPKTVEGVDYDWRNLKWYKTSEPSSFYMTYAVKN